MSGVMSPRYAFARSVNHMSPSGPDAIAAGWLAVGGENCGTSNVAIVGGLPTVTRPSRPVPTSTNHTLFPPAGPVVTVEMTDPAPAPGTSSALILPLVVTWYTRREPSLE